MKRPAGVDEKDANPILQKTKYEIIKPGNLLPRLGIPHSFWTGNRSLDTIYREFDSDVWNELLKQHKDIVIVSLDLARIVIRVENQKIYLVNQLYMIGMECTSSFGSYCLLDYDWIFSLRVDSGPVYSNIFRHVYKDARDGTCCELKHEGRLVARYSMSYSYEKWVKHIEKTSIVWLLIRHLLNLHQIPPEVICHFADKRAWTLGYTDNSFKSSPCHQVK